MSGIATSSLLPDPAPRRHEEELEHRAFWQFSRWALPPDALAFHVPNGGQRHRKAAQRLSGLGVVRGVPDLAVVWRGKALFLEFKSATGRLSADQRSFHRKLEWCGAPVAVCRSAEDAEAALRGWGVPLQGTMRGWAGERLA